ncbi:MAG: hypothetical protein ACFE7R_10200 [Candidatus Hodarchaeota archaeon]
MSPKRKAKPKTEDKSRYLFKLTVVGPEDPLLESFLVVINEQVVSVDGIRIGATNVELDDSRVSTLFMSPKHAALDILLSLTYKGAKGVIIVLREADPELETVYRNEIRANLGEGVPTRVCILPKEIDDFKRNEINTMLDGLIEEMLENASQD